MNRFIKVIFFIASACSTLAIGQIEAPKDSVSQVAEQPSAAPEFTTINVCRPGALTKMFSNLDFYLNGKSVGEIKNKTTGSFKLRLGDKFKIGQESSILMARYYDDFALFGTATEPSEIYVVLRVKSNLSDALVQAFGGALVLGAAKSFESGNSKNWDAEVVDKEKFVAACTFN